ncbi:MAG: fasciclin domain-containing protein [Lewinellaceae bacterium]|nr:fasciclin domain-containing protein [Lewinellaceae bacterium]
MEWETLEFDFTNEVPGTAALNLANSYDKASIFFNFGTTGADAGEKTYFWDDVELVPAPDSTVVDIIVNSPDHTTLETAVIAAYLTTDDLSGIGPFTVFAPTDAAFDALPAGALDALLDDPTGALAQALLYHVLGAEVLSTSLSDYQMVPKRYRVPTSP